MFTYTETTYTVRRTPRKRLCVLPPRSFRYRHLGPSVGELRRRNVSNIRMPSFNEAFIVDVREAGDVEIPFFV